MKLTVSLPVLICPRLMLLLVIFHNQIIIVHQGIKIIIVCLCGVCVSASTAVIDACICRSLEQSNLFVFTSAQIKLLYALVNNFLIDISHLVVSNQP